MKVAESSINTIKKAYAEWERMRQFTPAERSFLKQVKYACSLHFEERDYKKITLEFLIPKNSISLKAIGEATRICKKYGMYQRVQTDFKNEEETMSLRVWNGMVRLPYNQGYLKLSKEELTARGFF